MACIVIEMIDKLEKVKKASPKYAAELDGMLDQLGQLDQKIKGNTVNVHTSDENGYEGLSNMNAGSVTISGVEFNTVEHAFQYIKAQTLGDQDAMKAILKYPNPFSARKIGRGAKQKVPGSLSAWDGKSTDVMKRVLEQYYTQSAEGRDLLLSTGNKTILHNNLKWADKDKWVKMFPKLLMEIRSRLVKAGHSVEGTGTTEKPVSTFQGYVGGFDNIGKGKPEGDGKDKAMRKVANNFIGEFVNNKRSYYSSSLTSLNELDDNVKPAGNKVGLSDHLDVKYKDGVTRFNDGKTYTVDGGKVDNTDKDNVYMLARNGALANTALSEETKGLISNAHSKYGATFVVGDMPGVDSQFIEYLDEIGASYKIYHTGNTSRIKKDAVQIEEETSAGNYDTVAEQDAARLRPDEKGKC